MKVFVFAILALVAFGIGALRFYMAPLFNYGFDQTKWVENQMGWFHHTDRIKMVDNLIENGQLDGLSRTQVEGLLGVAKKTKRFSTWDLVYWLGPERGFFRIDSEWLVVKLDENDNVELYEVVRD